ncbi:hypothetical protein DCAR_0622999 [Daucus carota subsp. sativus]|uniref:SWI/SNF complex subunit SWI3B n=1 Tax=Daucus carota subsp. sativus TaxID=79200 RepID=A0AAF0X8V9_DAUCS|nr:PREDICTED: SWI/SNF complex subunit SWI3B isoform X1 [Daucus carota subsp. sativus]WOH03600.1 hypothetical protein DCAR_0622999 [Daucus carota subsp. sativus]
MAMPSGPAVTPPPPSGAGASNNGDSHLKLPILTPSRPSDVILIPSYSRWFSWKNIDECEVRNLPEFFEERSASKNPRVYKYYRNSIIQSFRLNPTRKITFTEARKTIIGDVGSVRRVFDFLEAWGLINYFGAPSSKPQKLEDKDISKSSNDGGAVPTAADSTPSKKRVCGICKSVCTIACFARDKDDVTLCARCFVRGSYKVGPGSSDFRRVEISDEEKTDWTDKETLHLLEAIMHYRDDWKKVAEHVNGRTVRECVSHFVKLSFGEQFAGPLDSAEVNDNIIQSTGHTGTEPVSQTSTVPPAKKMRLSPLADSSNPIMAQAAFLSALVGVDVAEAAAHAAILALHDDFNGTNFKEKIGSCTGGNTRHEEPCLESDRDAPTVAPIEAFDEARLQLTKEEAELERSISGISVQMEEFQNKMMQFGKFDLEVEKESKQLEQLTNLLFADQLALHFHKKAGSKSHAVPEDFKAGQTL